MLGLRLAIPSHWKAALSAAWHEPPPQAHEISIKWASRESSQIENLSAKRAYTEIISSSISNIAYVRWLNEDQSLRILDAEQWAQVCLRPFLSTQDTRLQSFQYNLINHVSPCCTYLKQIRIYATDT